MKIAFDGGAFQQAIAGGIFNVAVGFLNAARKVDNLFSYILVVDPRLGPVREELLAHLSFRPEIVLGRIGPAYGRRSHGLTTDEPRVRFEIDGMLVEPSVDESRYSYAGPPPTRSFYILSRAARPSETRGSQDTRLLGIPIQSITISDDTSTRHISIRNSQLQDGFYPAEAEFRWTTGCAKIPVGIMQANSKHVNIVIQVAMPMTYKVGDGIFDMGYNSVLDTLSDMEISFDTAAVEANLKQLGVSIFFSNHFIPAYFKEIPTVSWLYDMIPLIYPSFFMGDARENFAYNTSVFRRSKHVFSISEASRQDLIRLEKISPERVSNVGIDIGCEFKPASPTEIGRLLRERRLENKPYILCVGTLEPRKNHRRLIRAFDKAFRQRDFPYELVIVGKRGWDYEGVVRDVHELNLMHVVRILDEIPNAELVILYSGALMCVYPSLYEGFGLPILEAMACCCPVLTSDVSSMPEIAGDAAYLVDPSNIESIADGMIVLADDLGIRNTLIQRGIQQRMLYSWSLTASRILSVINNLSFGSEI